VCVRAHSKTVGFINIENQSNVYFWWGEIRKACKIFEGT
jgi:hypothetical protein